MYSLVICPDYAFSPVGAANKGNRVFSCGFHQGLPGSHILDPQMVIPGINFASFPFVTNYQIPHRVFIFIEFPQTLPRFKVPKTEGIIIRTADASFSVSSDGKGPDPVSMSFKYPKALP